MPRLAWSFSSRCQGQDHRGQASGQVHPQIRAIPVRFEIIDSVDQSKYNATKRSRPDHCGRLADPPVVKRMDNGCRETRDGHQLGGPQYSLRMLANGLTLTEQAMTYPSVVMGSLLSFLSAHKSAGRCPWPSQLAPTVSRGPGEGRVDLSRNSGL